MGSGEKHLSDTKQGGATDITSPDMVKRFELYLPFKLYLNCI